MATTKTEEFKIGLAGTITESPNLAPIKDSDPDPSVVLEFERLMIGGLARISLFDPQLPAGTGMVHLAMPEADWLKHAGSGAARRCGYTAKPKCPEPGKEPTMGGKGEDDKVCGSAAIASLHKTWLAKVSHKRQCEACSHAVLKLLAYMFPI